MRADHQRTGAAEKQRVTIGRGFGDKLRSDGRVRACAIFDYHLHAEQFAELGREIARHDVIGTARRKTDNQAYGFVGELLAPGTRGTNRTTRQHGNHNVRICFN